MDELASPVTAERNAAEPQDGIGIAFSGGGYRAMLFHAGAIVRLHETGFLARASRISSVSGGSIVSAKLALEWERLHDRSALFARVIDPIHRLADTTVDVPAVLTNPLITGGAARKVAAVYAARLFGDATLQDLPESPVFVINATNVETGSLWRFSRARARDWQVGEIASPRLRLADVVAASSAFPPILSPFVLGTRRSDFTTIEPHVDEALLENIALTDGGVYDNLGLEAVFKRCKTVLVSNGGRALPPDPAPPVDWVRHMMRVTEIIHGQVTSVRTRQLLDSFTRGDRDGAYWGVASDIAAYGLDGALPAPVEKTRVLAETPTRLCRMDRLLQQRLVNWGYAVCDAAIRRWMAGSGPYPPPAFPYPEAAI